MQSENVTKSLRMANQIIFQSINITCFKCKNQVRIDGLVCVSVKERKRKKRNEKEREPKVHCDVDNKERG